MEHETKIEFKAASGNYRAQCTCGWYKLRKNLAELQGLAACHDLDDEPKQPTEGKT